MKFDVFFLLSIRLISGNETKIEDKKPFIMGMKMERYLWLAARTYAFRVQAVNLTLNISIASSDSSTRKQLRW